MEGWSRNCERFGEDQGMDASYWSHYGGPQGMEPTGQVLGGWNPGCDQQQGPSQYKQWSRPPSTSMDANFEKPQMMANNGPFYPRRYRQCHEPMNLPGPQIYSVPQTTATPTNVQTFSNFPFSNPSNYMSFPFPTLPKNDPFKFTDEVSLKHNLEPNSGQTPKKKKVKNNGEKLNGHLDKGSFIKAKNVKKVIETNALLLNEIENRLQNILQPIQKECSSKESKNVQSNVAIFKDPSKTKDEIKLDNLLEKLLKSPEEIHLEKLMGNSLESEGHKTPPNCCTNCEKFGFRNSPQCLSDKRSAPEVDVYEFEDDDVISNLSEPKTCSRIEVAKADIFKTEEHQEKVVQNIKVESDNHDSKNFKENFCENEKPLEASSFPKQPKPDLKDEGSAKMDLLSEHINKLKEDRLWKNIKSEMPKCSFRGPNYTAVHHFYFKPAKYFHHFHFVYNLMRDCKSRVEKALCSVDQTKLMSKDVVVRIGIAGNFHKDNLNLIPRRIWKGKLPENQHIWDVSPLLCFQNNLSLKSVLKIVRQVSAQHRIIIKSDTVCNERDETNDSITIVGENKQQIMETITTCLEEPFHNMLEKWLEDLINENCSTKLAYDVIAEIEAIRKLMIFDGYKNTDAASILKRTGIHSIVPGNVKEYLFELSDVYSFGIWRNLSLKVFVKKTTDEKKLKEELMKINNKFFENFELKIEKRKLVQKQTLKQGDRIMSCLQDECSQYHKGTLGGFVREINNKRKIYALTCNHIFPLLNQPAYIDDFQGLNEIGACVFTTREQSCDFAAIEVMDSFAEKCDVAIRRDDQKRVNARLYTESLDNLGLVFKIGATTNVTKGYIISSEFYDKLHHDNIFLVKGIDGSFSEEGDSGSLVFSRPKSAKQTYVNVLGMVFANNVELCDDDVNDHEHDVSEHGDQVRNEPHCNTAGTADTISENISVCFRMHTALELFKGSQISMYNVQFQDDLSEKSSSSLESYSSDDSLDNL